jgi:hypothetical protein
MRYVVILGCAAYWCLLTALLLTPSPASLVGLRAIPAFPGGDHGIHFAAFAVLTLLVHGTRWPRALAWPAVAALLAYGIATESLQYFVPPRQVELLDYVGNILGVLTGTGAYWCFHRLAASRPRGSLAAEIVTHDAARHLLGASKSRRY